MTESVVVVGSGYAGAGAVKSLESALPAGADLTWVSKVDHHLVLHESHRCIRKPAVKDKIAIPIETVKADDTAFVQGYVENVDPDERTIEFADRDPIGYDYLVLGIGSSTAFFGIDGLEEYAHTLKSLDDALGIHEAVAEAGASATQTDPARIVVGGAGLSGIQTAGELAGLREDQSYPLEIYLVEGLDEILPGSDPELQEALRARLQSRNVHISTGSFIGEVDEETVYLEGDEDLAYDVVIWTGGITGREAARRLDLEKDERTHRINAGQDFQTEDDRIFAIGDAAIVDQPGSDPAPPTAQAAWQAAEVVGENVARAMRGESLKRWTFSDKGTVISVGESAVANDVYVVPFRSTFGGLPAKFLKKAISARWIRSVAGTEWAIRAWPDM